MKIFIASDHGGFEKKNQIIDEMKAQSDISMLDLGPEKFEPTDDYPDFAKKVCEEVVNNTDAIGILLCKSGNGMVIAANKVVGCYASLCFSPLHAEMARRHDNANILCLDADYTKENVLDIVNAFIKNSFESHEERHVRRFGKILTIENSTKF